MSLRSVDTEADRGRVISHYVITLLKFWSYKNVSHVAYFGWGRGSTGSYLFPTLF